MRRFPYQSGSMRSPLTNRASSYTSTYSQSYGSSVSSLARKQEYRSRNSDMPPIGRTKRSVADLYTNSRHFSYNDRELKSISKPIASLRLTDRVPDTYSRSVDSNNNLPSATPSYKLPGSSSYYHTLNHSQRKPELLTARFTPDTCSEPEYNNYSENCNDSHLSDRSSTERTSRRDTGGLIGLKNIGNTCFMNSILQCLSNTKPLRDYILRGAYQEDINRTTSSMRGSLIRAYAKLMESMWTNSSNSAISTAEFKAQLQRFATRFMGYSQQDAQEFLRYLLQGIHEDVNLVTQRPPPLKVDEAADDRLSDSQKAEEYWRRYLRIDNSEIVKVFVGQLKSELRCSVCDHVSTAFDPFWDLSLPVSKRNSDARLKECFSLFMSEEILDGNERPKCDRCKQRRKCFKSFSIQKFPQILVLHLKRFNGRSKLSAFIEFPMKNLDLSEFSATSKGAVYDLYAVCNHSGSISFGHYTAYCKHPDSHGWHVFNDALASTISASSIVSSEAYVLFYHRRS